MDKNNNRILLKISGEGLGDRFTGDFDVLNKICDDIKYLLTRGFEVAIVVGAGNMCRGASLEKLSDINRSIADQMGMLATIINALSLHSFFMKNAIKSVVYSSIVVHGICEKFSAVQSVKCMEEGAVVILAGGTGNSLFTTDTAAVLRAIELGCSSMFKATLVDGVYDDDPKINKDARKLSRVSYKYVIDNELKIMDATSIILAKEYGLPIKVFSMIKHSIKDVIEDSEYCTLISYFG